MTSTSSAFKEGSLRREARLSVPPAMTLPDWAAHDLLDVLRPDSDEDETPAADATLGRL
ncbi:hypothetical protein ACIG0C_09615 [Kitasatospora aureofaciens]|nr:hypothetical protein [Kitasatospora aureofaciens]UKZ09335.1 hypothetical protein BOQ63_036025 [Streptomyces viridifaciens]GGU56115.1 hypothetical protein GCM10010502_03020 [Kitasatospora aureofaciens]